MLKSAVPFYNMMFITSQVLTRIACYMIHRRHVFTHIEKSLSYEPNLMTCANNSTKVVTDKSLPQPKYRCAKWSPHG